MTECTGELSALEQAASAVDRSTAWQFLAGSRRPIQDSQEYRFAVASRGLIPLVTNSDFGDIGRIVIDCDPGEDYRKVHFITFIGDEVGLELFVSQVTGPLDGGVEEEIDIISGYVSRNPFWGLTLAINQQNGNAAG